MAEHSSGGEPGRAAAARDRDHLACAEQSARAAGAQPVGFDWDEIDAALRAQADLGLAVDRAWTQSCARRIRAGELGPDANRLAEHPQLAGPDAAESLEALPEGERRELAALGRDLLARGVVAAVVLNGGMATRFGGVVKGVVPALGGRSFLELKLRQALGAGAAAFLTMNSFATQAGTRALFASLPDLAQEPAAGGSGGGRVRSFLQSAALRLTPAGEPFRGEAGELSFYAPGHGEFAQALARSGELGRLQADGVELLLLSNVDNLGADLEPEIVGYHASRGCAITCEVAQALHSDRGGTLARAGGRLQIVEGFRFPADFDFERAPASFMGTNTFLFSLPALAAARPLAEYYVEKQVGSSTAVQIESVVNELVLQLPTRFLAVPRGGARGRFFPVKTPADLEALRGNRELASRFSR